MEVRINKYLSQYGVGSRRQIEKMLWDGEFKVNGVKAIPGQLINTESDKVTHKDKQIKSVEKLVYYLLNKPIGYVSTVSDEFKRQTVLDLVPKTGRLYPVGRLDKESTGLIIITNDGDLALRLTHPRYHLPKTYKVKTQEKVMKGQLRKLEEGVQIQGKTTLPAVAIKTGSDTFEITIHQGMKRQIRQMCNEVGLTVKSLTRISIGHLTLGNLGLGEYRDISQKELDGFNLENTL